MPAKRRTRAGRGHGFAQALEWSSYKHRLLENYLRVWCYKLGAANTELAFVDACAGAGKYADGSDGSPLIAAKYNDEPAMVARGTGMTVYAFETDADVYPQLVTSLAPYTSRVPPRAFVSQESFFDDPKPILDATRRKPTLFFVDPYGTEEVTWDRMEPLLSDVARASTEVLVRIDPTLLARYAGWVRRQSRTARLIRGAAGFARLLERLNVDTEQIAEGAAGALDDADLQLDKYELLEQYLRLYWKRFRYVQVAPIRANYWAAPKYMIIHGTDSAHGAAHLNDIVSKLEDNLYTTTEERKEAAAGQASLFGPPQRPPSYSQAKLDEQVVTLLKTQSSNRFIELRAELAMHFGPNFREKDHKSAVKRMLKAGRIEMIGENRTLSSNSVLRVSRLP